RRSVAMTTSPDKSKRQTESPRLQTTAGFLRFVLVLSGDRESGDPGEGPAATPSQPSLPGDRQATATGTQTRLRLPENHIPPGRVDGRGGLPCILRRCMRPVKHTRFIFG